MNGFVDDSLRALISVPEAAANRGMSSARHGCYHRENDSIAIACRPSNAVASCGLAPVSPLETSSDRNGSVA